MELFHYVDRASPLGKMERTAQGGYRVPGTLARVGVMPYLAGALRRQGVPLDAKWADHDLVRIYQGPEVLKQVADTFVPGELPVTREHPPKFVTPATFRQEARGTVTSMQFDGQDLKIVMALQDGELISDVEMNVRRGLSPGYMAATVFEAGKTEDGQEYDGYRVQLVYNHAGCVKNPRGGEVCHAALDSDEIPSGEVPVKLKIKGVEVDAEKAQDSIAELEGELAGATARATKAEADLQAAQALLTEATSPEAIQKHVQDAKDAEVKAAEKAAKIKTVKGFYGDSVDLQLAETNDHYLSGLLKGVEAAKAADPDGLNKLKGVKVVDAKDKPAPKKPRLSARDEMIAANHAMLNEK